MSSKSLKASYDFEEDRRNQRITENESYLRRRGYKYDGYGYWSNPDNPWGLINGLVPMESFIV